MNQRLASDLFIRTVGNPRTASQPTLIKIEDYIILV